MTDKVGRIEFGPAGDSRTHERIWRGVKAARTTLACGCVIPGCSPQCFCCSRNHDPIAASMARLECNACTGRSAEIERLRQGLWDVYRVLGFDTDGDETPRSLASDIVKLVVDAAKEHRADCEAEIDGLLKGDPNA